MHTNLVSFDFEDHPIIARLGDDEKGRNSIPPLGGQQEMSAAVVVEQMQEVA